MVTLSGKKDRVEQKFVRLDFKEKKDFDFYDHRKGYFLSAFIHNNDTRVTIVKHGHASLTFELLKDNKGEPTKWCLKYFIDSQICQPIKVRATENKSNLYILSELVSDEPEEVVHQGGDTIRMKMTLLNVSEPNENSSPID